jgi:hypothetical protein
MVHRRAPVRVLKSQESLSGWRPSPDLRPGDVVGLVLVDPASEDRL